MPGFGVLYLGKARKPKTSGGNSHVRTKDVSQCSADSSGDVSCDLGSRVFGGFQAGGLGGCTSGAGWRRAKRYAAGGAERAVQPTSETARLLQMN